MSRVERRGAVGWKGALALLCALAGCGARAVKPALATDAGCAAADCGAECGPGYERTDEGCVLRVPRPIAPLSTSTVTSQQPSFRWELPPGTAGARIEICRDRAFTVQCQTVDADGTTGRVASALERGVWFWRLRGRSRGSIGTLTSAVWQFHVGARSAPVDTSHGTVLDVNGDGYADLAVGAPNTSGAPGRVHVYLGSAEGLSPTPALSLSGLDADSMAFGVSVASAGDVNGDGYADLAVGGLRVHLYLGSATGLSATPTHSLSVLEASTGYFGWSLTSAGDVNGDGYADVAVGEPSMTRNLGRVHVYLGSAMGPGPSPALVLTAPDTSERDFGFSLSGAGDLNGDGYADLAVGAPGAMNSTGRVHVYFGSASGPNPVPTLNLTGPDGSGGRFGMSLTTAGDVNGDGYADLAVGAHEVLHGTGRVYVFPGSATGLRLTPTHSLTGPDGSYGTFGRSLASAGDVNGDGYADLVAGASEAMLATGRAHLYLGRAAGPSPSPSFSVTGPEGQAGWFGWSVTNGGDFDGDGYADLVVGAPGAEVGHVHAYRGRAAGLSPTPDITLTGPEGHEHGFGSSLACSAAPARTRGGV